MVGTPLRAGRRPSGSQVEKRCLMYNLAFYRRDRQHHSVWLSDLLRESKINSFWWWVWDLRSAPQTCMFMAEKPNQSTCGPAFTLGSSFKQGTEGHHCVKTSASLSHHLFTGLSLCLAPCLNQRNVSRWLLAVTQNQLCGRGSFRVDIMYHVRLPKDNTGTEEPS